MKWYLKCFEQYTDFDGRARPKEYWMFFLFNSLAGFVMMILDQVLDTAFRGVPYGWIWLAYSLFAFLPALAVLVRRLHDTNRSGGYFWISFIPFVGAIWLLILLTQDGTRGPNQYGEDPLGRDANEAGSKGRYNPDLLDQPIQEERGIVDSATADLLLVLILGWQFLTRAFYSIGLQFFPDLFMSSSYKVINMVVMLISMFVPFGLALAVRNPTKRTIMFVLAGIIALMNIYSFIEMI